MEFLEARQVVDELIAGAAIEGAADWQALYTYRDVKDSDGRYVILADSRYPTIEQAAHIARYNPARILRQCEATRAIIGEFLHLDALGDLSGRSVAENALRQLAMVHADHPDFAEDWI